MSTSPHVFDVGADDFDVDVIERSHELPILVDFWAPWCGPCRMLTPVLEQVVEEHGGKVVLAKVNTEDHPAIAERYRIRGIPAVKLFRGGRVVGEFVGALPGGQVRAFLREHVPSEADVLADRGLALVASGDTAEARQSLEQALSIDERHPRAHLALARLALVEGDADRVERHVSAIDSMAPERDTADSVRKAVRFVTECRDHGGEQACRQRIDADESDLDARYALGCCLAARGQYREALAELLEVVARNRRHRDEAARKAMLTIFDLVGRRDPLADEYVRKLQIY